MRVRAYLESSVVLKASECIVSAHFVVFCKLQRPFWHNMAVVLNCINTVLETVELCKVPWDKSCVGIFLFCAGKRVFFLGNYFDLLLGNFIFSLFGNNPDVDQVGIANEETFDLVKLVSVLIV
jgi:hypothetical protein